MGKITNMTAAEYLYGYYNSAVHHMQNYHRQKKGSSCCHQRIYHRTISVTIIEFSIIEDTIIICSPLWASADFFLLHNAMLFELLPNLRIILRCQQEASKVMKEGSVKTPERSFHVRSVTRL